VNTTTTTVPPEVAAYLAAVRRTLSDLPPAEQEDLLSEVEASLLEGASEGGALSARLGSPEEFAAELRSAAGLQEVTPAAVSKTQPVREALDRLGSDPRVALVVGLLGRLAPIWWVARAYIAVAALALAIHSEWSTAHPSVPRFGSGGWGLAAIVLAAIVSVAIGLFVPRKQLWAMLVVALNVAVAIAAVPVARHLSERATREVVTQIEVPVVVPGFANAGNPVTNIYPFSRDGRLLHDVLLYDGAGQPLNVAQDLVDPARRVLYTRAGLPIFNSFPIRYFEPGTRRVARPNAAPRVTLPRVATPPLAAQPKPRRRKAKQASANRGGKKPLVTLGVATTVSSVPER
jgi:uncharacterized membrane protein